MNFEPTRRALLVMTAVVLLGIAGVFIAVTLLGLRETAAHARQTSANIAGTLAENIHQTLDTYDRSLRGTALELLDPAVMALPPELREKVVFDKAVDVPGVSGFGVVDANGDLVMSSQKVSGKLNVSDRAYFSVQRALPGSGLFIDGPLLLRQSSAPSMVLSRPRVDASGNFAGVVATTLRLEFFDRLLRRITLDKGSRITLLGQDMRIIARVPPDPALVGKSLATSRAVQRFQAGENFFEEKSALTGDLQLYTFEPVSGYPMAVSVSSSVSNVYASWRQRTWWLGVSTLLLMAACVTLVALFLQALNARRALAKRMQQLAHYDPLTGLPNRLLLRDRATQMLEQAHRDGRAVAVMYLDLDGFKDVNDALGHAAGDALLMQVSERLCSGLRKSDTLSREGGDEFVVLAPLGQGEGKAAAAERVAHKLVTLAAQPYQIDAHELRVTTSVGIAMYPQDGPSFDLLSQRADAAMYQSKRSGKNRFLFYDDEIGRMAEQELARTHGA